MIGWEDCSRQVAEVKWTEVVLEMESTRTQVDADIIGKCSNRSAQGGSQRGSNLERKVQLRLGQSYVQGHLVDQGKDNFSQ